MTPRQLLLFPLPPLEGEALCSWLLRLARANGHVTALSMANSIWGQGPRPATPTVLDGDALAAASEITGFAPAAIVEPTFDCVGHALAAYPERSLRRWALPKRSGGTSQAFAVCQQCLGEDLPYWRSAWRLAVSIRCSVHGCLLLDHCSVCASPLVLSLGRRRPLDVCEQCAAPLRCGLNAPALHDAGDQAPSQLGQTRGSSSRPSEHRITDGEDLPCPGLSPSTALPVRVPIESLFWDGLWTLASGACRRRVAARLQGLGSLPDAVRSALARLASANSSTSFEALGTADREVLLRWAWWTVQHWPERFVTLMRDAGIHRFMLLGRDVDTPFWIASVVHERLARARYRPSLGEVAAAAAYLQDADGRKPALVQVKRLMGITETHHLSQVVRIHTRPFDWADMTRLAEKLDHDIEATDSRRAARSALLRDATVFATCALRSETLAQICALTPEEVCGSWVDALGRDLPDGLLACMEAWRRAYEEEVRPRWALLAQSPLSTPHTVPAQPPLRKFPVYFLTRWGQPYRGTSVVTLTSRLLSAIGYPDRWRGISVVRDLNSGDTLPLVSLPDRATAAGHDAFE